MRISDEEERNFYLKEALTENWSVRVLNATSKVDITKECYQHSCQIKKIRHWSLGKIHFTRVYGDYS